MQEYVLFLANSPILFVGRTSMIHTILLLLTHVILFLYFGRNWMISTSLFLLLIHITGGLSFLRQTTIRTTLAVRAFLRSSGENECHCYRTGFWSWSRHMLLDQSCRRWSPAGIPTRTRAIFHGLFILVLYRAILGYNSFHVFVLLFCTGVVFFDIVFSFHLADSCSD